MVRLKTFILAGLTFFLFAAVSLAVDHRYSGEVYLPVDLTTRDGVLLKRGKFAVEIRYQQGGHSLIFLNGEKVVAAVPGHQSQGDNSPRQLPQSLPLIGTLRLAVSRPTTVSGSTDASGEETRGPTQYLTELDWNVTLRAYRSLGPDNPEVVFCLRARNESEKASQTLFKLALKEPEE